MQKAKLNFQRKAKKRNAKAFVSTSAYFLLVGQVRNRGLLWVSRPTVKLVRAQVLHLCPKHTTTGIQSSRSRQSPLYLTFTTVLLTEYRAPLRLGIGTRAEVHSKTLALKQASKAQENTQVAQGQVSKTSFNLLSQKCEHLSRLTTTNTNTYSYMNWGMS